MSIHPSASPFLFRNVRWSIQKPPVHAPFNTCLYQYISPCPESMLF